MNSNWIAEASLKLLFNGTPIPGIADNAASAPLTNLYVALHNALPTADDTQDAHEIAYAGYERLAVTRDTAGFTVTGLTLRPSASLEFPRKEAGATEMAPFMTVGVSKTGAGKVLARFKLTPPLTVNAGVIPRLSPETRFDVIVDDPTW